jgi:hypothetical protein
LYAIAIGFNAGGNTQGQRGIAIGYEAGKDLQSQSSVAIGEFAGRNNQGTNSIAIGESAGETNQAANSIVLNATGATLDAANTGTFVKPIRSAVNPGTGSHSQYSLWYDPTTAEIFYNP